MSVFTPVTPEQLSAWLVHYSLGALTSLKGILVGVENTNYIVSTTRGRYVLTLFEKLSAGELPFFLDLMAHLARHGIPCPAPLADNHGRFLGELNGKPASIVSFLPGAHITQVHAGHCATLGKLLANLHMAAASYGAKMPNPRGRGWWNAVLPEILPYLNADTSALLCEEVSFQSAQECEHLPCGVIHADVFRDNVLWDDDRLGGIVDFYFACNDVLLYDVAIAVNDWCVDADGTLDDDRTKALLGEYQKIRPFTGTEYNTWPAMLRAGALRFWLSRLQDLHMPRAGALIYAKDPRHFQRILELRIANQEALKLERFLIP
jgi:homoserine kinase type II